MKKKSLALLLSLVLVIGVVAGSSLAWLTAKTTEVKNVFSTSDINVELIETTTEYKMVPGWTIAKDPKVTVKDGSEPCYVFVKIDKSSNYSDYLDDYQVNGWTQLKNDQGTADTSDDVDVNGVFYQKLDTKLNGDWSKYVLAAGHDEGCKMDASCECADANGYVSVKAGVTKEMMDAIDGIDTNGASDSDAAKVEIAARPTLTFTVYASQLMENNAEEFTAYEAWLNVFDANANGTPDVEESGSTNS